MNLSQAEMTSKTADAQAAMFVRMAAVVRMTGLGRSTIYRLIAEHRFPSPVRLRNFVLRRTPQEQKNRWVRIL